MKQAVSDLNKEIWKLKDEGMSLRQIAVALGISHEAVRKRLKAVKDKEQVSTTAEDRKLTASTIKKENVSTGSNAHKSRASEELGDTVNLKQTSTDTGESVNPSANHSRGPLLGMKGVNQRVDSDDGDLLSSIRDFLAVGGVEMYRMKTPAYEGYQIEDERSRIRFYVFRKGMME